MSRHNVGRAFSTGFGLALGWMMTQSLAQTMSPSQRTVRQLIICHKCGNKNPGENRFCGQCGQALYPPPPIQCPRCTAIMASSMKFCGKCGFLLRKMEKTRKKRKSATS